MQCMLDMGAIQQQIMIEQSQEKEPSSAGQSNKALEQYKKKLLFQVVAIFSICLLVILERIFYQVIVESEQTVLSKLQLSSDLVAEAADGSIVPAEITNSFLTFLASLSEFRLQFLIVTHVLVTLYVGFDPFLATKLTYVTMGVIYCVSLLQMFYSGARPFWSSEAILSSGCLSSYNHPALGLILAVFIPYYGLYCWRRKAGRGMGGKAKGAAVAVFLAVALVQFINYFTGGSFLVNIGLSVVVFLLSLMVLVSLDGLIDAAIRKSTVIKVDAKKYVFYWLLFICLAETFVLIVYSGEDVFLDINWVQNYISCTKYQGLDQKSYRYDEVIGPWFTFLQTAAVFAWIGAVFGISACYRKMAVPEWAETSTRKRVIRSIVANLLVVPSWIFVLLLEEGSWIRDIGMNEFIVDAIHFFILYIWLFGYMPVFLLEKTLKLTNKENEDFYVILKENK